MGVNIILFHVKIYKLGTIQLLIYSDADSQFRDPLPSEHE